MRDLFVRAINSAIRTQVPFSLNGPYAGVVSQNGHFLQDDRRMITGKMYNYQ
jgi:hypothetical protein